MSEFIVGGWYTPDYRNWVIPLLGDLEEFGYATDFVEVEPPEYRATWESRTLLKPTYLHQCMERHPDQIIIWLDVDCRVLAPLDELVTSFRADIGFYMGCRYWRNDDLKIGIRSGTMLVAPTSEARGFVELWESLCFSAQRHSAQRHEVDQDPLAHALCWPTTTTFQGLPLKYCATEEDRVSDPAILHSQASREVRKVKG